MIAAEKLLTSGADAGKLSGADDVEAVLPAGLVPNSRMHPCRRLAVRVVLALAVTVVFAVVTAITLVRVLVGGS